MRRTLIGTTLGAILLGCALFVTVPGCALKAPPAGTYTSAGDRAWKADQLLKDLQAAGQTARNLNGIALPNKEHLSDKDTALVRDFSLIAGAGLNAWGSGATTLAAARASIDTANLPPGLLSAARAAFDQAVTDHGAGAGTLFIVIDVYKSLRANISVDAVKNPKLAVVLGALDASIAAIPPQ